MDLKYWSVRKKDGHLVLKYNVYPMGIYVSFDPAKRTFFRHNVPPLVDDSAAWLPIEASRIYQDAVVEATAYAITKGRP